MTALLVMWMMIGDEEMESEEMGEMDEMGLGRNVAEARVRENG